MNYFKYVYSKHSIHTIFTSSNLAISQNLNNSNITIQQYISYRKYEDLYLNNENISYVDGISIVFLTTSNAVEALSNSI